jgi:amino acid transporter
MLALYFKCMMMMSLALPTFTILSFIVLLYIYMCVCVCVCGTIPASRIAGYQWGSGGGETTLSERLPCGHMGAFHSSGAVSSEGETVLRARCRMGP